MERETIAPHRVYRPSKSSVSRGYESTGYASLWGAILSPAEQSLVLLAHPCRKYQAVHPPMPACACWKTLGHHARELRLGPRFDFLEKTCGFTPGLPEELTREFHERRQQAAVRNRLLIALEEKILGEMENRGVRAFPVKGTSLSKILHDDATARFTSDLDIAVPAEGLPVAAQVVAREGFQVLLPAALLALPRFRKGANFKTSEVSCVRTNELGRVVVELHWQLYPGEPAAGWKLHEYAENIRSLSPTSYFFYLCTHLAARGWTDLSKLCDAGDFFLKFENKLDAGEFLQMADDSAYWIPCGISLELLAFFFGIQWEKFPVDGRIREAAQGLVRRPFLRSPVGTALQYHRERMRYLDGLRARMSYARWLLRPTHQDWATPGGELRSGAHATARRWFRLVAEIFHRGGPAQEAAPE